MRDRLSSAIAARPIELPRPPEAPPAHRFPVIATLAPLVVSAVLFLVTRSAFTLAFAALGPIVAIASVVDARIVRARTLRRENARFALDVETVRAAIDVAHDAERAERARRAPDAMSLLARPTSVAERWRQPASDGFPVRIGCAALPSDIAIGGASAATGNPLLEQLRERASMVESVPVVLRLCVGVGLVGPPVPSAAVLRALALQLAARLTPADWSVAVVGSAEWIARLPHPRVEPNARQFPPASPQSVDAIEFR